jgi:DNA-binding transcriptional regulator YiaG
VRDRNAKVVKITQDDVKRILEEGKQLKKEASAAKEKSRIIAKGSIEETEKIRNALGMKVQDFSVALGLSKTGYGHMLRAKRPSKLAETAARGLLADLSPQTRKETKTFFLMEVNNKGQVVISPLDSMEKISLGGTTYSVIKVG